MQAFIFDPLWEQLTPPDKLAELQASGLQLEVVQELRPLREHAALYAAGDERLLCVNPDYVQWSLTAADYQDIPGLRAILPAATAFNWIDVQPAAARGIPICNVRNFSTQAVAEWALLMAANLARRVPELIKAEFPLDFGADYLRYRGLELRGRRAVVLGMGHIGRALAERCAGLGMQVSYWSPHSRDARFRYGDLDALLPTADLLLVALAITPESRTLLTPQRIAALSSSCILVSVVHELLPEAEVLEAVAAGRLWGYGCEAQPGQFAAYQGNVWAAPAYAWATQESMERSQRQWIDNMLAAAEGRFPQQVN